MVFKQHSSCSNLGQEKIAWTVLGETANKGDTQITLANEVNWHVGDMIVIATTGHRMSQAESEVRYITKIEKKNGKTVLTLNVSIMDLIC